jgi:serine/threonine protein kinase
MLRGQYLIGKVLAEGVCETTYLAFDTGLETKVAIKEYMPKGVAERTAGQTQVEIPPSGQHDYESGLASFLDGARTMKKFSNQPNIVAMETVFRENGTAYMVLEYVEGTTLEEFLLRRNQTISSENALRILTPVMDALSVVHAENVVHGDINPSCIILSKSRKAVLTGFDFCPKRPNQRMASLKEGYAPEELFRPSGVPAPASDVYGVAAVLYRAITGLTPPSALDRLAEDQLESPSQLSIAIPANLEQAMMKALSVRAADRFPSIADFKDALSGSESPAAMPVAKETRIPPVPPLPPPPAPKAAAAPIVLWLKERVRTPKRMALTAAGVLVMILGAMQLRHGLAELTAGTEPQAASSTSGQSDQDGNKQADDQQPQASSNEPDQASQNTDQDSQDANTASNDQPDAPAPVQVVRPRYRPVVPVVAAAPAVAPAMAVDAPVAVAAAPAPPIVAPVVVSRGYESMLAQADGMVLNTQYTDAAALLGQAIQMYPARWQAYDALAKVELYNLNEPNEAFVNYRAALAHGGHATFFVEHDHGSEEFSVTCSGWLSVSKGMVSFKAADAVHTFPPTRIKEAKRNKVFGRILSASGKSMHAFHIRLANHQNFNFAPTSSAPKAEADFIVSVAGV